MISQIIVLGKKYDYSLFPSDVSGEVHFKCEAAGIDQVFLAEDLAQALLELPDCILTHQNMQCNKDQMLRVRVAPQDKERIEKNAADKGFSSVSDYIRSVALN